jgi:hypothetical protein
MLTPPSDRTTEIICDQVYITPSHSSIIIDCTINGWSIEGTTLYGGRITLHVDFLVNFPTRRPHPGNPPTLAPLLVGNFE